MKRIYLLIGFIFVYNISFSQCAGPITLTSNPSPDSLGFFAQGTSVTFTLTVNGYDSAGSFEGLNLNYGNGWNLNSLQSITAANTVDGNGLWGFNSACTPTGYCSFFGSGFYYDRFDSFGTLDGDPGNDYGDYNLAGNGSWTFDWKISVDSLAGNTSLNGNILIIGYPMNIPLCEDEISMNSIMNNSACHASFSALGSFSSFDSLQFSNTSIADSVNVLWNFGDGSTATANNLFHSFVDSGTYNVCFSISDSSGCSDSVCISISICQFNNATSTISKMESEYFVYPNPVSNILILNSIMYGKTDCFIYNIQSSKKYFSKLNEGENKIDVSMLPSGLYFIKVFNDQYTLDSKFVKE